MDLTLEERYRAIVKQLITRYAAFKPSYGDIEVETIIDETHGHYELLYAGWLGHRRIHGSVLHIDVRHGQVWIQHDGTGDGIAEELVEAGVPRQHIVLAFHHPAKRQFTPFAPG